MQQNKNVNYSLEIKKTKLNHETTVEMVICFLFAQQLYSNVLYLHNSKK